MNNPEKFRPTSALIMGWILIAFFTGFTIQAIFYAGIIEVLVTSLASGFGAFVSYLWFLKPYVLIFDEGITIVNPTKEITVSWDRVEEIETKYSMSIVVNNKTFYAWAAPVPSRRHAKRIHKTDFAPRGADYPIRLGDSPGSDSGACAYISRLRRKNFLSKRRAALNIFEVHNTLFSR